MSHPTVLKILREKPPVSFSQSLLMSSRLNSLNFVCFPIGFYALIFNCDELIGEKPEILESISNIIQSFETGNQFDVPTEFPKYAKISLVAFFAKKNFDLSLFYDSDDEFASICVFFLICFKKFNESVDLLSKNMNVISFLLSNFIDGLAFVGPGRWIPSLIEFAIYCSANNVFFETKSWIEFISMVFKEEWPQYIVDDQCNFVVFSEYLKNHDVNVY